MNNKLTILKQKKHKSFIHKNREERLDKNTKLWKDTPQAFNPYLNPIEILRVERSWELIKGIVHPHMQALDIGAGWGALTKKLLEAGVNVTAIDPAQDSIKRLPEHAHLTKVQGSLPLLDQPDQSFELIVCTDVIAELDPHDYRLAMAELCRILQLNGYIVLSTPLDIYSDDSLERFITLVQTEFEIIDASCSHHALSQKIHNRRFALKFLEQASELFLQEKGMTHCILLCKRKKIF